MVINYSYDINAWLIQPNQKINFDYCHRKSQVPRVLNFYVKIHSLIENNFALNYSKTCVKLYEKKPCKQKKCNNSFMEEIISHLVGIESLNCIYKL